MIAKQLFALLYFIFSITEIPALLKIPVHKKVV